LEKKIRKNGDGKGWPTDIPNYEIYRIPHISKLVVPIKPKRVQKS